MNPTRTEKLMWSRLVSEVGCIACRLDGRINHVVSIHHIDGRTKPGAHSNVLPLCAEHHQTGGDTAPAIHPWKRRFEAKYGTQAELKAKCDQILFSNDGTEASGQRIPCHAGTPSPYQDKECAGGARQGETIEIET